MLTGKMIRNARESVGENQTDFAKRFGVDQSAVSDWERKGPPKRGTTRVALEAEIARMYSTALIQRKKPRRVSRETAPSRSPERA